MRIAVLGEEVMGTGRGEDGRRVTDKCWVSWVRQEWIQGKTGMGTE